VGKDVRSIPIGLQLGKTIRALTVPTAIALNFLLSVFCEPVSRVAQKRFAVPRDPC
jgi:hypothetical protein